MSKYEISNQKTGVFIGVYEAGDATEALEAVYRDAGYSGEDEYLARCGDAYGPGGLVAREIDVAAIVGELIGEDWPFISGALAEGKSAADIASDLLHELSGHPDYHAITRGLPAEDIADEIERRRAAR